MDRKLRSVGLDGIVHQHIEHGLFPIQFRVVRQPRAAHVIQRGFISCERLIRLERHPRRGDLGLGQPRAAFFNIGELSDPLRCGVLEIFVDASQIQKSGPPLGKLDLAHGFQRHSKQVVEPLPFRFEESLYRDVVRDIVSRPRRHNDADQQHG